MKPLNIDELDIGQKIGQMLIARPPRSRADKEYILNLLRNKSLGGIQVTGYFRAVTGNSDLDQDDRDMIAEFKEAAGYPLLIMDDMECGFAGGKCSLVSPMALGSMNSEKMAYEFGRITAIEAKAAGYNTVFGPCLDLASNPKSSAVGTRSFGSDKELVARLGCAVIRGYQDEGMIVTAKHFPGSGAAAIDNHIRLAPLNKSIEQIMEEDLYPYIRAIKEADLSGIMMGQVIVPAIDPDYPATLSAKMNQFLRERLNFKGLVITDSFTMVSVRNQYSLAECLRYGMAAGNDMVMTSYREDTRPAYEAMVDAYQKGYVTQDQIDRAVTSVLRAQIKTLKPARQSSVTQKELDISQAMSEYSITAVTQDGISPALDPRKKYMILIEEGNLNIDPAYGKLTQEYEGSMDMIHRLMEKYFVQSDIYMINEFPSRNQMFDLLRKSIHYDHIIMIVYNKSIAYTGSSDLTPRMLSYMEGVRDKLEAIVMFGNPYAARQFPPVPRLIFGYEETDICQEYAVKTLVGEHSPKGKLPVNVKLHLS